MLECAQHPTAQKVVAVAACIKVISETISQISIDIYKSTDNGREFFPKHPAYPLLKNSPNELMSSAIFHQVMMSNSLIYGNAYALIVKDARQNPTELILLNPSQVEVKYDEVSRKLFYRVQNYKQDFQPYEIIHVKGASKDGIIGLSPLSEFADAIGLGIAQQVYASKFFANGANMNAVVTSPKPLTIDQVRNVRNMFRQSYGGVKNSNSVGVLPDGMDIRTISSNPVTSQLLESRIFTITEISRIFRVPLHMINELTHATFSNIEHQDLEFVKYTLMPWVRKFEQEYNSKLFKESEKNNLFARFNIESLMRGDTINRTQMYTQAIQNGWLSRNEVRQLEGFNKYEGGDE